MIFLSILKLNAQSSCLFLKWRNSLISEFWRMWSDHLLPSSQEILTCSESPACSVSYFRGTAQANWISPISCYPLIFHTAIYLFSTFATDCVFLKKIFLVLYFLIWPKYFNELILIFFHCSVNYFQFIYIALSFFFSVHEVTPSYFARKDILHCLF